MNKQSRRRPAMGADIQVAATYDMIIVYQKYKMKRKSVEWPKMGSIKILKNETTSPSSHSYAKQNLPDNNFPHATNI